MLKLMVKLFLVYLVLCGGMYLFQRKLMYLPTHTQASAAQVGLKEVETQTLTTEDGVKITAWVAAPEKRMPVIVHVHGNGGDLTHRAGFFKLLTQAGYGLVAIDYRGFGTSEGSPTEQGLLQDGQAALAYAKERMPDAPIVLYGESLGTGVAVQLAAKHTVDALVLQSPYTSTTALAQATYPWLPVSLLMKDTFESERFIGRVTAPLLVIHGDMDRIVPLHYGKALYEAANEPKALAIFEQQGHNNLDLTAIVRTLNEFLTTKCEACAKSF